MARHLDESKWMKVGSLCTGSGGLDLAVKAFWPEAEFIWFAENDKDCTKVLAHHWPNVPNLGDLTKIDWHQVERPDLLIAGYPCQPYSVAGSRLGDSDERAIFSYIADACRVLSCGRLFFENVSGHTSLGGPSVIGAITGLGYDCRWGVVSAAEAGAPHLRRRWFCVARSSDASTTDTAELGPQGLRPERGLEEEKREARRLSCFGPYYTAVARWERILGRPAPDPIDDRGLRPGFVEWMIGLPENHICNIGLSRTAELKILGNAVVPAQAHLALELLHHDT